MPCGFDEAGAREQIATIADRPSGAPCAPCARAGSIPWTPTAASAVPARGWWTAIERLAEILHGRESSGLIRLNH